MKKNIFIIALICISLAGNAQIIKNNLLEGYKPGDKLEKSVYTDPKAAIQENVWCGSYSRDPKSASTVSPIVGKELNYPGYNEKGASIQLGFQDGIKGTRATMYGLTSSSQYRKGTYYLACLVNIPKLGNNKPSELIAFSGNYTGLAPRGNIQINRNENGKLVFTAGLGSERIKSPKEYEFNQTYLLVLKADYTNDQVELFINPTLTGEEPQADIIVKGKEKALKSAIKAIYIRNNHAYKGNIGNIRIANRWTDIASE